MSAYVRRVRLPGHDIPGHPPAGAVRYSRMFPTRTAAQREADAWQQSGTWDAEVLDGTAPPEPACCRPRCGHARRTHRHGLGACQACKTGPGCPEYLRPEEVTAHVRAS